MIRYWTIQLVIHAASALHLTQALLIIIDRRAYGTIWRRWGMECGLRSHNR